MLFYFDFDNYFKMVGLAWNEAVPKARYYYLAVRVCEMVLTGFNVVLTRVVFPSFVSLRDDRAALLGGVEAAMRFGSYILIPAAVGIALVSPEIISVLFGERWLPAAPILSLLAMAALVYALLWPIGDIEHRRIVEVDEHPLAAVEEIGE